MLVNIENMSAEELFELANKKKRAEEDAAKRAAALERVGEVRKRREQLMREFEQALAASDKEMQALQKQREQLITKHQAALAVIDKNLAELEQDLPDSTAPAAPAKPAAPKAAAPAKPAAPEPVPEPTPEPARRSDKGGDDLADVIMEIMVGRQSISESLLKEQLRTRGHSSTELGKVLDQMVRAGKLVNRGYGNYAPGKKR
jgi:Predicted membrane protein